MVSNSYCVNCGEDGIAVFCYSTGEERAYFSARTTNADVCVSGLASAQCMLVLAGWRRSENESVQIIHATISLLVN